VQIVHEICCGMDIHKKLIVACLLKVDSQGRPHKEVRSFGTMTNDILALGDWLASEGCEHLAMESTGVYWKPIFNVLEGQLEIILTNPRHMKAVPGRKTDVQDAEWIADLLQHGLLKPSFIPPAPQRQLRELTRYRTTLVQERARLLNRLHKLLEDANLKLASVATDINGASARAMLSAILGGETDALILADLALGQLRKKKEQLVQALRGRVNDHHRFILGSMLTHLDFLDEQVADFNTEIESRLQADILQATNCGAIALNQVESPAILEEPVNLILDANQDETDPSQEAQPLISSPPPLTCQRAIELLDTIPGVNQRIAEIILAEIGLDMGRFASAEHLASWAAMCPGNKQSAGKRLGGRTRKGNVWLRQALVEAAHGAMRTKECFLSVQGRRLVMRRGKKKAIIAVGHSILVIVYYILTRREPYKELGANYLEERERKAVERRLVGRLERLGYEVSLQPKPVALAQDLLEVG